MREDEVMVDTSAWLALMNAEPHAASILLAQGDARPVTTSLVLAEIHANALMGRVRHSNAAEHVALRCRNVETTAQDALFAAEVYAPLRKAQSKAGIMDCLIYAVARRLDVPMITTDGDLAGEKGVVHVRPPRVRR